MRLSQLLIEVLYEPAAPAALYLESRATGSQGFENKLLFDFEFGCGAEVVEM